MKRILSPATNPAGLTSLAAALYALGYGIWNVTHHRGAVDPQVIVAALAAVAALFTRQVVTPVTDPHDGAARKLMPAPSESLSGMNLEQIAASVAARELAPEPVVSAAAQARVTQAVWDTYRLSHPQPAATPDVEITVPPEEYRAEPLPVPSQPSSDPRERAAL